jgi:hypothetical protein
MASAVSLQEHGFLLDDQTFRRKIPFDLTPTALKGVYASPPPPDNFDPKNASSGELVKRGLLWRKPAAGDDPALIRTWQQVFSRKWPASLRIVPELSPQIGKTHILKKPLRRVTDQNFLNGGWAGAGFRGGSWTGIVGFWNVPSVSKPSEPQGLEGGWNSSSWLGIDGFDVNIVSDDVLQAGIQQIVNANGQASYVAWFEWFAPLQPNSPPYIYQTNITNFPVSPGQQIYCSVQYINNNTAGYLYLANQTTGHHFSITLAPPPGATFKGNSIEWVMEAPDGGEPESSLPKFSQVQFTSAIGCGPNNAIGNPLKADTANIETTSAQVLTSVKVGNYEVTVDFIG